jgi:hypothetical protein
MGPACFTKLIFFFGNGDSYILDKWFAMSIQALKARYWTVDAAGRPKFIRLHPDFPMLAYGQTTTSRFFSRRWPGVSASIPCAFLGNPRRISCAHGIALFILFGAQPTTTDDTGSTT